MRTVEDYASGKILKDVQRAKQKVKTLGETGDPVLRRELEESSKDSTKHHYVATLKHL
jgi:hypothetical protein